MQHFQNNVANNVVIFWRRVSSCGRKVMLGAIKGLNSREWRAINCNFLYHIYFDVLILLKQNPPHTQKRVLIDQRSAFSTSERQILCYNYGPT